MDFSSTDLRDFPHFNLIELQKCFEIFFLIFFDGFLEFLNFVLNFNLSIHFLHFDQILCSN